MSISGEINRIKAAKESLRLAINGKGRNIAAGTTLDSFAAEVTAIVASTAMQEKTVTPTTEETTVTPDEGYDGLSSVKIVGDVNLRPENVAEGVTVFGVAGTAKNSPASSIPTVYQSYVTAAEALFNDVYVNIFVAESNAFITVGFMFSDFAVTAYDSITKEFSASGWYRCSYNKSTEVWDTGDYRTDASTGGNFVSNIRYSSCYWFYANVQIFPASGSSGSVKSKSIIAARAMDDLTAGDTCYITNGAATVEYEANQSSMDYPASAPADKAVAFNLDGSICAMALKASPYIQIYDTTTNPWTKLQNPDVLPTGAAYSISFNYDASLCAVGHSSSPYVTIYDTTTIPWTKIADPDVLPTLQTYAVAFSHANRWLVVLASGAVTIYDTRSIPFTKDLVKSRAVDTSNKGVLAFSPDDSLLALSTYYSRIYSIGETAFTDITTVTIGATALQGITGAAFNKAGTILAYIYGESLRLYDTTKSPWAIIANPASLPSGVYYSLCFSSDGKFFAIGGYSSPYNRFFDTTTTPWTAITGKTALGIYVKAITFDNQSFRVVAISAGTPYITIYTFQPTTPLAYPAQEATSINPSYGYATEDIASGETGGIAVLFN